MNQPRPLNVLELFAGSGSIRSEAETLGMNVFSSDIEPFLDVDYVVDIMDFNINQLPWHPDIIWASPPCTGFSVAAIGKNWDKSTGIPMLAQTLILIGLLKPTYYFIENPRGMMRKMPMLEGIPRHTVTYCQYGDTRMKPTDIWTNNPHWTPKAPCKNGDLCHTPAPRGSTTGTQGLKGAYERSIIPPELCREILMSCLSK